MKKWHDLPEDLKLGRYQVNKLGKVRNKKSKYVLCRKPRPTGYIQMSLKTDTDKYKSFFVHRLIALTFIPNPDDKFSVDHINREKADNRVENLRWATRKEQHDNRDKTRYRKKGIPVLQLDKFTDDVIKEWDKMKDAQKALGICSGSIGAACRGKYKTAGGFKWQFAAPRQLEGEVWRYAEKYNAHISNLGRVKSAKDYIFYGNENGDGYMTFSHSKTKAKCIHIAVAELFIPKIRGKDYVNHKDGNKAHNYVDNLEWNTTPENMLHAHRMGLITKSHRLSISVQQLDMEENFIKEFPSLSVAGKELGIARQTISKVCQGIFKQTHGFKFRYVDEEIAKLPRCHREAVKINLLDEERYIVKTFDSPMDAARELKVSPSNIHQVCKGVYNQTGGYCFAYA